jgi:D-serine deaminase-like pyridoxal phosphate-dependent protein
MDECYQINDPSQIFSPALVIFQDVVEQNLDKMINIAGDVRRLRPHCKTHKMPGIIAMELAKGIRKHKCATLAEAEMLAAAGVRDIFLAYNLVGPNIQRAVRFRQTYPDVTLAVTADHPAPLEKLSAMMTAAGLQITVLLDLDVGMQRTGVARSETAKALYEHIATLPGVRPGGLHLYDGHNHQSSVDERTAAVQQVWDEACRVRDELSQAGCNVPKMVAGGTGSFPIFSRFQDPSLELSPGTCVLHDAGYSATFEDLGFQPAALVLTRVVSKPASGRITLDAGNKAVAADPPMSKRLCFPELPDDTQPVMHNEEHLVLETSAAESYQPGDVLLGIPCHICPTSALHREVHVVREGQVVERWPVVARDRCITI